MGQKLVTEPAEEPVSLEEAKLHLREDSSDQDDLIEIFIKAARQAVEKFTGLGLIDQTWDIYLDEFPTADKPIEMPLQPVVEVVGLFYIDGSGAEQEIDVASYRVDDVSVPSRISAVSSWPSADDVSNAVRARVRVGYLDTNSPPGENVPAPLKSAMLLIIGNLYAQRETIVVGATAVELPWAARFLMEPYRVHRGFA